MVASCRKYANASTVRLNFHLVANLTEFLVSLGVVAGLLMITVPATASIVERALIFLRECTRSDVCAMDAWPATDRGKLLGCSNDVRSTLYGIPWSWY